MIDRPVSQVCPASRAVRIMSGSKRPDAENGTMPDDNKPETTADEFDAAAAAALLADVTAPWVRDLGLEVKEIGRAQSHFFLPFSDQLTAMPG